MTQLFIVDGRGARPAEATTLADAELWERRHLQEWVIANPGVLGEDVLVVTSEYANWAAESDGVPARERLDILGLDSVGRLVVVELKRDVATRDIHLQAITYAAMVSRFTLETLAQAHAAFLSLRQGASVAEEDARALLLTHVDGDLDPDILKRPRLALIASSFPKPVTSSVVWLSEMSLDISLIQVSLWRAGELLVADFSIIYPTPEVAEFTLVPKRDEAGEVTKRIEQRTRGENVVPFLVKAGVLLPGTRLRIVPTHGISADVRNVITEWLGQAEGRSSATWTGAGLRALRWRDDDYSPTGLAQSIHREVTGTNAAGIRGPRWLFLDHEECPEKFDPDEWSTLQDKSLVEVARILGIEAAVQGSA